MSKNRISVIVDDQAKENLVAFQMKNAIKTRDDAIEAILHKLPEWEAKAWLDTAQCAIIPMPISARERISAWIACSSGSGQNQQMTYEGFSFFFFSKRSLMLFIISSWRLLQAAFFFFWASILIMQESDLIFRSSICFFVIISAGLLL